MCKTKACPFKILILNHHPLKVISVLNVYIHKMSHQHFVRRIGFFSATSIVIGSVIGSAIFMKPATMAAQLGSPVLMIIVWVIAGIISLFGAMAFAELGTMFPETGGQYVYLQQAFGDKTAYLYGWSSIAVVNTAAIAAIAYVGSTE